MTDVSIIIPVHNAENWLRAAIGSAIAQQAESNCEVIVVNDGSTDRSSAIMAEFEDSIIAVVQQNRGAAAARNAGIARATGEYVKFLDADDYLIPGSVACQLKHAKGLAKRTISFGRMFRQEMDGRILPHGTRDGQIQMNPTEETKRLLLEAPVLPSILYPKPVLEQAGGFDERLSLMDDFDLFMRVLLLGYLFRPSGQPICVYRNHISDQRLSARSTFEDFSRVVGMFGRHLHELESNPGSPITSGVRLELGHVIWIIARRAFQCGHKEHARELFILATRAAGRSSAKGHPIYKAFTRLLGPMGTEGLFEVLKNGCGAARNARLGR